MIYQASATFGFEANYFTFAEVLDCLPSANLDKETREVYCTIHEFSHVWLLKQYNVRDYDYGIVYREVILGDTSTYQLHNYFGYAPITVSINPDFAYLGRFNLNGVDFVISRIEPHIKTVRITNVESGKCGEYNDVYTEQEQKEGGITFDTVTAEGGMREDIKNKLNADELGWKPGPREYGITIQNEQIIANPSGSVYSNTGYGAFTFNNPLKLRPAITHDLQTMYIKHAKLEFDYEDTFGSGAGFIQYLEHPTTNTHTRIPSVHVDNQFVHQEFEVKVKLLATTELDFTLYEGFLDDPYFVQGDWVWNEEIGGQTDVSFAIGGVNPITNFLDNLGKLFSFGGGILGIILMIVIIAVVIFLLIYFKPIIKPLVAGVGKIMNKTKKRGK